MKRFEAVALFALVFLVGCTTVAEHRKLEYEVDQIRQANAVGGDQRTRYAQLVSQVDALRADIARLEGRLEVAEHNTEEAMREARAAREQAYQASTAPSAARDPDPSSATEASPLGSASTEELTAYRTAYASWRSGDSEGCIDRFRGFLQSFPSSEYADDATYWMADCYFKQGDFKTAILRFDDVAGRYPAGNKAADALYRQGEALKRLGPSYGTAARKAFERVINEYPDSPRADEAKGQIELLRTG